jgi:oligopeptide transport system permease protein
MKYVFARVLSAIPTLLGLFVFTFLLLRLAPGGPFDSDRAWPEAIQRNLEAKYGLDRPLPEQFARWMISAFQGDLGTSFQFLDQPVTQVIRDAIPASLLVGGFSLFFALALGIPLGCLAALKRGTWLDWGSMILAVAGISLPSYLVASLLILVFAMGLGWLPPALWESPASLILPVVTLALRPLALIARLTRASVLDAIHADYARTARAKGADERRVLFKHVLRNSLIPVLALLGPLAANLITGSFVIETVFQLPGLGKHFVTAILNRDYPLAMGMTLTYGVTLLSANLAFDLLTGAVDPRVRFEP